MKNSLQYILLVASSVLAISCGQQQTSENKEPKPTADTLSAPITAKSVPVVTQYNSFLAKLDSSQLENVSVAAEKFKDLFQGKSPSVADSGYVLFDGFYERAISVLNEAHFKDTINYLPLVPWPPSPKKPLSEKLKQYQAKLTANGFEIAMSEGSTYLKEDRDFVARHFYPHISPALKAYLAQLNKENKEGYAEDASLTLAPTQFADRLLWRENFLKQHPAFILRDEITQRYKSYLYFFLHGMDNTPVLSFDTKKLDPYFAEAYQYLDKKAPASETNKLVKPYFQLLQKGESAKAAALLEKYEADKKIGF